MSDEPPLDSMDKRLFPSKPLIPPKCRNCGDEWQKVEEESGEYHEVYEPVCDCYEKDIRLNVG